MITGCCAKTKLVLTDLLFQVKNVKCHKPFFAPSNIIKIIVIVSLKRFVNPFTPGNFAEKRV